VSDTDVVSIEDALITIAEGLARNEEANARILADDIVPVMPDLGAEGRRQILDSCRANVRVVVQLLERGPHGQDLPSLPPPPLETLRYIGMLVRRSLDIDSLLNGYRVGHAALWRCCAREAFERVEDPVLLQAVLEKASEIIFRFINAALQRVYKEYEVERGAHQLWPIARKLAVVNDLLQLKSGPSSEELGSVLGYDVSRGHIGFVVHVGSPSGSRPGAPPAAGVVAGRIAQALPAVGRPLVLPTGDEIAWIWLAGEVGLSGARRQLIRNLAEAAGATVGIGEPADGVVGFRETHHQAQEALDVALMLGRPVAGYRKVALMSALSADRGRAQRMMRCYLGALEDDTPGAARLRETLRVLLDNNLNQRETARQMGMHAHTISYRLRQIEEILGQPLAECALEVRAALLVRDVLRDEAR
jgi:DNA-binding PucR family transcriptional regulator